MPSRFIPLAYLLVLATVPGIILLCRLCPETGLTSLLRFGSHFEPQRSPELQSVPRHVLPHHGGYDAQFYAEIALALPELNPAQLNASCDLAAYRARRILLPALAALLGLGHPPAILQILALLNLAAWFGLAALAWHLIPPVSWTNAARFSALVFASGVLESIRASLPDLPALFLILAAVLLHRSNRPWSAALLLALAGLCKETSILAVALFLPKWHDSPATWLRAAAQASLAAGPTILWWIFLRLHFGPNPEGTVNFAWPLLGWIEIAHRALNALNLGHTDNARWIFFWFASLAATLQLLLFTFFLPKNNALWKAALGSAVLLPFLAEPVWSGYWALTRNILPLTAACILLLPAHRSLLPLLALISIPSVHALFRLVF